MAENMVKLVVGDTDIVSWLRKVDETVKEEQVIRERIENNLREEVAARARAEERLAEEIVAREKLEQKLLDETNARAKLEARLVEALKAKAEVTDLNAVNHVMQTKCSKDEHKALTHALERTDSEVYELKKVVKTKATVDDLEQLSKDLVVQLWSTKASF
mmetsp:Transcript_19428/g.23240  ORF Transcript_19428/g.23240 Transcript_19428/m.23240 type:complete len:160 (-) Transcript_19428:274-753(-)|eukprot:CAMPEP_0197851846 /NCGR_PEP_ID=MMETSP1438-20131217/19024_1 /TAXON_ID=1461541 /ORGANISM="Pterosperma sp., Strain CCMP1384" /LENGTH=159 /DNA_ID=CAMNT_0043465605 /DNA_START=95 /DNA_END=574 /DNA_ORIENTATION=+